jgi:hypothetical protein
MRCGRQPNSSAQNDRASASSPVWSSSEPDAYERFPEEPANPRRLHAMFERFGLPERLT